MKRLDFPRFSGHRRSGLFTWMHRHWRRGVAVSGLAAAFWRPHTYVQSRGTYHLGQVTNPKTRTAIATRDCRANLHTRKCVAQRR